MSESMTVQTAAEQLWRAVRDYLTATVNDNTTEEALIARLSEAREIGVMIEVQPRPRIGIAGCDSAGRFAQSFELRDARGLN